MKTIFYIALFLLLDSQVEAQTFHLTCNVPGGQLVLTGLQGKVQIEGYDGTELTATYRPTDSRLPAGIKGLKAVYAKGTDNTGLGLFLEQTGNNISFKNVLPERQRGAYLFKVPKTLLLHLNSGEQGRRYGATEPFIITGMQGDLEIKSDHGEVILNRISGAVVVSANDGKVTITPDKLDKTKPISVITRRGEIILNLPPGAAADLAAKTLSGQLYANVPLGKIGGGGTGIHLQSLSGNIYIRQK